MKLVGLMKRALEHHAQTGLICRIRTIVVSDKLYKELYQDINFAPPRYGIDIRHGNIKGRYFFEVLYHATFDRLGLTDEFLFVPYHSAEYEAKRYLGREKTFWETAQAPLSVGDLIETDRIRGTWRQPFTKQAVEFLTEADAKEAVKQGIEPSLFVTNKMQQGNWTAQATDMTRIIYYYLEGLKTQPGMLYLKYVAQSQRWQICVRGKYGHPQAPQEKEFILVDMGDPINFIKRAKRYFQDKEILMGFNIFRQKSPMELTSDPIIPNWLENPINEDLLGWVSDDKIHVSDPSGRGWYFPVYL